MFKKIYTLSLFIMFSMFGHPLDDIVLFSGNSNIELAQEIGEYLNIDLGEATIGRFNDGEINIQLHTNTGQKDVFIIQSTCSTESNSINDNIMELFLLIRTVKRLSVRSITIVIPYYGYARQDRKVKSRVPISAADMALLLETAGIDRVVTVDLHCGQIQGFFRNTPVDNLYGSTMFVPYIARKRDLENVVVISPDAGGVERASQFMKQLREIGIETKMGVISKQRAAAGVVDSMHLIGEVINADTIIVDDLCDTGGTLIKAAELLKEHGARRVFAVITHPVFSNNAIEKIGNSTIDEMIIANTIPLQIDVPDNVTCISVAPLLGEAIKRIQLGESVSPLFEARVIKRKRL